MDARWEIIHMAWIDTRFTRWPVWLICLHGQCQGLCSPFLWFILLNLNWTGHPWKQKTFLYGGLIYNYSKDFPNQNFPTRMRWWEKACTLYCMYTASFSPSGETIFSTMCCLWVKQNGREKMPTSNSMAVFAFGYFRVLKKALGGQMQDLTSLIMFGPQSPIMKHA